MWINNKYGNKFIVLPAGLPNEGLREKLNLKHWLLGLFTNFVSQKCPDSPSPLCQVQTSPPTAL